MIDKEIIIHSKTSGYDGFFKITLVDFQHTLFQGGWSPIIRRELFGRGQAVVVMLYDCQREMVVLVEQCRAGALEAEQQQAWLLEPVAGMIDVGETPIQACQRETREEAGIEIAEFDYICQFYPSPGASDEILHLYAAEINSDLIPEFSGLVEDVEDIRLVKLPFSQAKNQLLAGQFNVASTIIGLQWLFFQRLAD